jgi:RimJ/RimL family protein N-acetyltransferase
LRLRKGVGEYVPVRVFLETDRLVLRRFTEEDVDNIVELDGDPEVMRYLTGGRPTPRETVRDVIIPQWLAYYERYEGFGFWAAIEKATGEFIGWFHFRPPPAGRAPEGITRDGIELGYRLRRSAWSKGYAPEGSRALIRKGFTELGVERVYAQTMTVNTGSRRVMEKAGLRYLRTFRQNWPEPIPGDEHGEVEYALTKAEWEAAELPGGPSAPGLAGN